jgi:hypothetical protein
MKNRPAPVFLDTNSAPSRRICIDFERFGYRSRSNGGCEQSVWRIGADVVSLPVKFCSIPLRKYINSNVVRKVATIGIKWQLNDDTQLNFTQLSHLGTFLTGRDPESD